MDGAVCPAFNPLHAQFLYQPLIILAQAGLSGNGLCAAGDFHRSSSSGCDESAGGIDGIAYIDAP